MVLVHHTILHNSSLPCIAVLDVTIRCKCFSADEESEGEEEEDTAKPSKKKKKDNPMFLKDYEREVIVQCKG